MKKEIEKLTGIKPQKKEEKIEVLKIAGEVLILAIIGWALIYFGCLFS